MSSPDETPPPAETTPLTETPPPAENFSPAENAPPENNDESANKMNLLEVPINNENDALNVIIGFLSVAQRRGAFAINESSKIFECVKKFQKPPA